MQSSPGAVGSFVEEGDNLEEVLEVITDPYQSGGDEEDALDVFESYTEIRRKLMEKKKLRGFTAPAGKDDPSQWRLSGTVRGKLEVLKSKTKCHYCRKTGHWKRECPEKRQAKNSKVEKTAEAHSAEVWIMEETGSDGAEFLGVLEGQASGCQELEDQRRCAARWVLRHTCHGKPAAPWRGLEDHGHSGAASEEPPHMEVFEFSKKKY